MTRFLLSAAAAALALASPLAVAAPALAQDAMGPNELGADLQPAPLEELVSEVDIPYERFELDNGLTVLVHEDRKAPVVAVSVWYEVGSKNEPEGKTGFAHLFEHLMFNGTENVPGEFFEPLQQIGATDTNGTTWFDRTNYFETVPTGALDVALFLESDRMGHLLGAVTQEVLDNQIGVVQNEKRQGDNQPFGLVEYEQLENLYPSGHPYHHSTIGSMADLSGSTLKDAREWFRNHYGPNNAVLVLAGDIDVATAREKVERWFGAIPSGPAIQPVDAPVPTLPAPLSKTIYDQIATPRVYRMWAIPGYGSPDYLPLFLGGTVLGGLASSRLDEALVRQQEKAVSVVATAQIFAQAGQFLVWADARPGVSIEELAAALDAEIARFVAEGPTEDELQRAATSYTADTIRGLEQTGGFSGKAPILAQGLLYNGDPAHYKTELEQIAAITPAQVRDATARWLSRPVFALTVEPGTRTEGGENRGGYFTAAGARMMDGAILAGGLAGPAFYTQDGGGGAAADARMAAPDRSQLPAVGPLATLDFPEIERATLSNGMEVYFARREAVPTVSVRVAFDAGFAADPADRLGLQSLMLAAMNEGTTSLDSSELAIAKERLGVELRGYADSDTTNFGLDAVTPNLAASLDLLADYVRNPAFEPTALERVRSQQLTRIDNELNDPSALAQRAILPLLYGDAYPYGRPPSGTGTRPVVASLTRDELVRFHDTWLRPDNARVLVVGDTTLAEVVGLLEASFGDWTAPPSARPVKTFDAAIPAPEQRIVLIDRPASPQSVILAGRVLDQVGTDDLVVLGAANEVFGGSFLSRINMNLRETKGWSYGVRSQIRAPINRTAFLVTAPVQADRTGDSIAELMKDLSAYTGGQGVTPEELRRLINGNVRELPGQFETSAGVLSGLSNIVLYGRPDDYYETLSSRYQGLTAQQLDEQALATLLGNELVFVIVGDADVVAPQLEALGLPVEVREVAGG